jgi:hypothetical protein
MVDKLSVQTQDTLLATYLISEAKDTGIHYTKPLIIQKLL